MKRLLLTIALGLVGCTNIPDCGPVGVPTGTVDKWQTWAADWQMDRSLMGDMEKFFHDTRNPEVAYHLAYLYGIGDRFGFLWNVEHVVMRADDLNRFAAHCGIPQAVDWLSLRYRHGRRGYPKSPATPDCLQATLAGESREQIAADVRQCGVVFTGFRDFAEDGFYRRK